ncbi:MAG: GntR family transcriptional regulator [Deferrisomatales bacterium]|nr:GntR family transcriptional regulator [Deferrisomatales bacterium]
MAETAGGGPLPASSIRERVYEEIKERIVNGAVGPTERLVETRLAEELRVSRTPVREALHVLKMEGLLEPVARGGYRVRRIRWEEVEEICEIRAVSESLAARWAIERASPEDLLFLKEQLDAVEVQVREGRPESFVDGDAEFHEALVRASGSKRLFDICQSLRAAMLLYRIETLYDPEIAMRGISGHRRILDRLIDRDPVGVEAAIREHLAQVKRDIWEFAFLKSRAR